MKRDDVSGLACAGDGRRADGAAQRDRVRTKAAGPGRLLVERFRDAGAVPTGNPGAGRSVTVNLAESSLGWLHARGMISDRQRIAGEQLRDDWTRAGLAPSVTMRWDPVRVAGCRTPHGHGEATLVRIAARRRFDGAIARAGHGLSDILWRVVCAGEGLVQAEAALGWPKRAGKLVLGLALDRVADHYGLA